MTQMVRWLGAVVWSEATHKDKKRMVSHPSTQKRCLPDCVLALAVRMRKSQHSDFWLSKLMSEI